MSFYLLLTRYNATGRVPNNIDKNTARNKHTLYRLAWRFGKRNPATIEDQSAGRSGTGRRTWGPDKLYPLVIFLPVKLGYTLGQTP